MAAVKNYYKPRGLKKPTKLFACNSVVKKFQWVSPGKNQGVAGLCFILVPLQENPLSSYFHFLKAGHILWFLDLPASLSLSRSHSAPSASFFHI